ncbi:MAG: UbiA family prenyltransferase [Fibrobacter sp.]|jgi:4-hydroxybenzoate polyprenyltransferase/phosphoserine phosphatase|nr:UbiA family prenyltransferase [Fibrobacter sp.]
MALSITNETEIPLVVDLDGTVIKSDLLYESALLFLKRNPLNIFLIIRWLLCGISVLKIKLAERVKIDIESLPYNQSFLEFLKRESEKGRELILATASAQIYSQKVADHLRIFSKVLATDEKNNLRGSKKLERLVSLYGEKGFDYAGDSSTDIVIFPHCRNAHLINASDNTIKKAGRSANLSTVDKKPTVGLVHSLKAARIYQWTKNLLLFVPLVTSHNILNLKLFIINVLGFFAFSLCASATYIMNDLFDLESDRKHPRKKNRPFASGDLSISKGILMSGILGLSGLLLSFFLRLDFLFYIVFYILLTSLYSFFLKKHVLVDVLTLAGLYTIRIFAGAKLIGVNVSFWLFAFSVFLFFGLALVKRCTELQLIVKSGKMDLSGRDYCSEDLQTLRSMGITGSFISVVVFALYINSTGGLSLYARPELLWAICPALLLWINRLWIKTSRGQMHDDPLIFTLKDNVSRYLLLFIFLVVLIAQIR